MQLPVTVRSRWHRLWASADVVLAVGTRLQHHRQVWGEDGDLRVVESTSTPTQMNRISKPAIGIVADAADGLSSLADALETTNVKRASREDELVTLAAAVRTDVDPRSALNAHL